MTNWIPLYNRIHGFSKEYECAAIIYDVIVNLNKKLRMRHQSSLVFQSLYVYSSSVFAPFQSGLRCIQSLYQEKWWEYTLDLEPIPGTLVGIHPDPESTLGTLVRIHPDPEPIMGTLVWIHPWSGAYPGDTQWQKYNLDWMSVHRIAIFLTSEAPVGVFPPSLFNYVLLWNKTKSTKSNLLWFRRVGVKVPQYWPQSVLSTCVLPTHHLHTTYPEHSRSVQQ